MKKYKTILTVFAHPDDEVLAAGATLSRLSKEGANVHIAIPSTGVHARKKSTENELQKLREDCKIAMEVLGVNPINIYFGNFADNEMDKHTLLELIKWLEPIIEKVKPDLILTHHRFCTNIDHQYCHDAVVVATRPSIDLHIDVICGEVPSSTGYLKPVQWEPQLYINVSEKDVDAKIKAMESYEGEARPDPHPRSKKVLKSLAKVRGADAGYYFAEAFMIQKNMI